MPARKTSTMKHALPSRFLPLLLLAACGSSGATTGSAAAPGPVAGHESLSLSAIATAPTEAQAYALARHGLLAALLADQTLLASNPLNEALSATVHVQASDPLRFTRVEGGIQAEIGLTRQSLRSAFGRLDTVLAHAPEPSSANPLASPIHALRLASLRRAACVRQRQLVSDVRCEPVDTTAESRRLEQTLAGVRLRPVHAGGIPMKDKSWLRPLTVVATFDGDGDGGEQPLPELPLRVQASDGAPPVVARTDARGIATQPIAKDTPAATTWTVSLDLAEMLGPDAKLAPVVSTTLRGRATGLARSALVHAYGKTPAVETGRALEDALKGPITSPIDLAEATARQISQAGIANMKDVAPKVAEHMRGTLDTILLLDAESEFASRMGTQRVWYEARGTLRVWDAWTGELVTEVSATVTEAGLGEERAESAARESLGRELAGKLKQTLGL
jgi:hypothetical protein